MASGDPPVRAFVWLERIRNYAPLAATLFGLLYAAGFVIVNAYLGGFGIRELEAVRTRYVGAGVVYLAYVAFALGAARQVWTLAQRPFSRRNALVFTSALVFGPLLLAFFEWIVLWRAVGGALGTPGVDPSQFLRVVIPLSLGNFILAITGLHFELGREGGRARRGGAPRSWGGRYAALVGSRPGRGLTTWVFVLGVVGVTLSWAEMIYPQIPSFLGGGQPARVRLVVSQIVADACPSCVANDVLLIDEDSHRFVILAKDDRGQDMAVEIFLFPNGDRAVIHRR